MATETIDIIVRENGARVVKRNLEAIGDAAQRSVRGLRLLQNTLFVLGGAGLLSALGRMVDTVANFRNRLSLLTTAANEAVAIQKELFDVARRTRTEFDTVSQVYTRTALAVRSLGISQRETIQFSESLMQASILSGASVRETNAALIQMSQALASNRFSGDEFRSVAEQLPFIIDVIGDHLGVTRGEVRQLGIDGKLTAEVILRAFREAREEISEKFARTIPTLSQSFTVFRTRLMEVIGNMDQATGISAKLAQAVIAIADNLEFLIAGLLTAGAAFAAWKLGGLIAQLAQWYSMQRQVAAAVASGNATLLTATGIEQAKAASALQAAQAESVKAAATVRSMQADLASLQIQRTALVQQQASIVIDNQRRVARDALTGRFIAYNAAVAQNIRTNVALQRTETMLLATKRSLTSAMAAQKAAQTALTAAQTRAVAANAAATTFGSRLATLFPGLTAIVRGVAGAFSALWAVIVANPIGAIIALIVAATAALVFFSDKIGVADDGLVTLRDVGIATFQLITEAIAPVGQFLVDTFGPALTWVGDKLKWLWDKFVEILEGILNAVKTYINFQIGLWVGLINSIIKAWDLFPGALADVGRMAINGLIDIVETGINAIINAIQGLLTFIGGAAEMVGLENPFTNLLGEINLQEYKLELTGAAREVGEIINQEFSSALSTDYIGNAWGAILERARRIAAERLAATTADLDRPGTPGTPGSGDGGEKGKAKSFEEIVRELVLENELLRENAATREKLQRIIQIEEQMKRSLTASERELVMSLLDENEVLTKAAEIYEEIKGPMYEYELRLRAINQLLKDGRISQDEFNNSIRGARIAFLEGQTDLASGLERGILKIIEKTGDAASQMEQIITSAFDGMSQAIADLVVDGEADFGQLIRSINKMIVQLVVSQAFQQLFGGYMGQTGGGNIFGGLLRSLFGGFKLPGFQSGGSFEVGAGAGFAPIPNGGNDNRLVAFRAQDGEQVTITPRGKSPGGVNQQVVVNFNITTPDVQGFRNSEGQLATRAARLISRAGRNS